MPDEVKPMQATGLPVMVVCFGSLDEKAAQQIVQHPDGGAVYEVIALADIKLRESWPGRKVLLWWNGSASGAADMLALGTRLTEEPGREVKFLSPRVKGEEFGPWQAVDQLAWTWPDFFAWAKPAAKLFTREAFELAILAFAPEALQPEPELIPAEPDDDAADAFIASLTDGSYGEPPPLDDELPEQVSERSQAFHVEPDGWPAPMDFWGAASLPEPEQSMLPDAISAYAFDQAQMRGVDPAQVLISAPVACAALLPESVALQMIPGNPWAEKARLWGAIVGEPSTKKSVGVEIADSHLRNISLRHRAAEDAASSEYIIAAKNHDQDMADWRRDRKKNPLAQRPEPPQRPLSQRLWTDDTTLEALGKMLSSHKRGRVLILRDELSGWFGSFDAYASKGADKDRPKYLSAYDGKETYIDRSTPGLSYHIPTWSVCILGGIQPSVLAKIAAKLRGDGMLQRFMLASSRPAGMGEEREADRAAQSRWQQVCETLYRMEPHPGAPVRFSRPAQELRAEVSRWLHKAINSGVSPDLQSALGKYEGLFGRLALTFHCVENAAHGREIPDEEITLATAERAWRYVREFLFPHALAFHEAGTYREDSKVQWVAGMLLTRPWAEMTISDLNSNYSGYRNLDAAARKELLSSLINAGWLRGIGGIDATTKMPTKYQINPAVRDGRFSEQAERYKGERQRYAELMPEKMPKKFGAQDRAPGED